MEHPEDIESEERVSEDRSSETDEAGARPFLLMETLGDVESPEDPRAAEVLAGLRRSLEALVGARAPTTARQAEGLDIARGFGDLVRNRVRTRLDARRGKLKSGPRRIDEIPVSAIVVGEKVENARVHRNEEQYQAMRSSVAEDGIDSPIGVVEDDLRPEKFHLVFGEGRLQAARDVGLAVVPAVIFPAGTPMLDLELAHFRENACRANLSSYEIAARASHLVETYGCTSASLSKQIGVPEGTIRALLSILSRLPQPIVEAWKNGAPELDRRTLQRLAEQPDHEAALSLWADQQAAFAAAQKTRSGRRKRFRPPRSRPTALTLGRLCQAIRTSTRESYSREDVVRIVEFAVGAAADIPNIFTPTARRPRASVRERHEAERHELPLPTMGALPDDSAPSKPG